MVILGGLELVVGGYIVHKYHKNKNEKKKLQEEAQQRRHNTFPGAKPSSCCPYPQQQQQQQPPVIIPQQKYAYYAPQSPSPQPHYQPQSQPQPRPYAAPPLPHTQSFTIPRRPLPQQQPPQIIQPLQRSDSFATISRMPIANGYRPSDVSDDTPNLPPRRYNSNLSPIPQSPMNLPYSHTGFSVSTPALGPTPATPPYSPVHQSGRQTVDDNWETYGRPQAGHGHYAPSESTALGEHDPPPPYTP